MDVRNGVYRDESRQQYEIWWAGELRRTIPYETWRQWRKWGFA